MKLSPQEIKTLVAKYFPYLEENEMDIFLSITKYLIFKKKEIILKSGRIDNRVFIILKGAARAYSLKDGIELNDHLRSDGYLFGDPKVFGNNLVQILDIEAIEDSHVLMFDIGKLESIGFENPKIMVFYINILKEIILTFSHRINTFVTKTSTERYEDLISWNPLYLQITYDKHIASFLGITPLTLNRIKKKLNTPIK